MELRSAVGRFGGGTASAGLGAGGFVFLATQTRKADLLGKEPDLTRKPLAYKAPARNVKKNTPENLTIAFISYPCIGP